MTSSGTHSARVYRLAYRLTGNPHDAEDLTQEVFVRVFRSLSSYTPGTFEGWLHRITTNLFLDSARRKQRIRFEGLGRGRRRHGSAGGEPTPGPGVRRPAPGRRHPGRAARISPPSTGPRSSCATSRACRTRRSPTPSGVKLGTVRSRIHRGRAQLRVALEHRRPRHISPAPRVGPRPARCRREAAVSHLGQPPLRADRRRAQPRRTGPGATRTWPACAACRAEASALRDAEAADARASGRRPGRRR